MAPRSSTARLSVAPPRPDGPDVIDEFEAFFGQHWSDVLAYARRRTNSVDDAHDVAAETFAVAWRRRHEVPADRAIPWLYRTAGFVLANLRRGNERRLRLHERVHAEPTSADRGADAVVDDLVLFAALDSLSDEQRELLLLSAWEGLDNGQLAEVFGISANAVASRLKRARQRLDEAIAVEEGVAR